MNTSMFVFRRGTAWTLCLSVLIALVALAGCVSEPVEEPVRQTRHMREEPVEEWFMDGAIYELFVRNFTPEGTLAAIPERLPELAEMGVKTIWLMPIFPVGEELRKGTLGSPYSVQDFYAVNPRFGTEEDLRAVVDTAHELGMRVILDWVANHSAWDNEWITENPDWYTQDADGNIVSPNADWTDVADFNYDNPEMWNEMKNALRYWVEEFDIDGYRADVAYLVPNEFWQETISELEQIKDVFMLAEANDPGLIGFDALYGWSSYHETKRLFDDGDLTQYMRLFRGESRAFPRNVFMRFTTNHDETSWDETPINLFGGEEGARAAAVVVYSIPGFPLLYNGQEVGSQLRQNLFEREPIDWSGGEEFREFYEFILNFWADSPAMNWGGMDMLTQAGERDVYAVSRLTPDEEVIVLVNVRDEPRTYRPHMNLGSFTDAYTGEDVVLDAPMELAPYEWRILVQSPPQIAPASE